MALSCISAGGTLASNRPSTLLLRVDGFGLKTASPLAPAARYSAACSFCALPGPDVCEISAPRCGHPAAGLGRCGLPVWRCTPHCPGCWAPGCHVRAVHGRCAHRKLGPLRNGGQWAIGAALGLYFTPEVSALVGSLWWAIVLGIVGAAAWLGLWRVALPPARAAHARVPASMLRSTSYFAGRLGPRLR